MKISEAWLLSIGFYQSGDGPLWMDSDDGFTLSAFLGCDNIKWLYCGPVRRGKSESVAIPNFQKRSEVLLLCKLLRFNIRKRSK